MRAVVVANGEVSNATYILDKIESDDLIVCANGGTFNALALGLLPKIVVGDIDSIDDGLYRDLQSRGTQFLIHSSQKDETDTELALHYCVGQGATEILLLGALGGRLDHLLANLMLLADPAWRSIPIRVIDGPITIQLCSAHSEISGQAGDVVSLLPWGGDVEGIRTEGLEYSLRNEPLFFGPARGVSNVMMSDRAAVSIEAGLLLVIHIMSESSG